MPSTCRAVIPLLKAIADDRTGLALRGFAEADVAWLAHAGLVPLLLRCIGGDPGASSSRAWPVLHAANLAALVSWRDRSEALAELLDGCRGRTAPPTALKGMSIAGEYYPEPHLRVMRDIDVLVEEDAVPVVEDVLTTLGYRRRSTLSTEFYASHHHSMPFVHPETGVWVEVHRGLFHRATGCAAFDLPHVKSQLRASVFLDRPMSRLSPELQVLYLSSHWATSRPLKAEGAGVFGLVDLIYLLRGSPGIAWPVILEWGGNSLAASHLFLLLSYLVRHGLVSLDPALMHALEARQPSFRPVTLATMHALTDHMAGRRAFGPVLNARNLSLVWDTLLRPVGSARKIAALPWALRPRRLWPRAAARTLKGWRRRFGGRLVHG